MPEARTVELLERVERKWRVLRHAAERLGIEGLERTTSAGWTAKEMLAHVAFWEEAVEGAVRGIFRGESTIFESYTFGSGYVPSGDWPRADEHNAREAAWARTQPPAAVLARWERAHASMVAFLATVTDDEIRAHERYFSDLGGHYETHLPELEALLDGHAAR
jgi:hypothetical protein